MSNEVFPSFVGISWPVKRTPNFNTKIQKAMSGRESRIALMAYPLYKIEIQFEYLSSEDWKNLGGFFKARKGKWDSFLFDDPQDNAISNQPIGVGNGVGRDFQLLRTIGGYTEPIENPKAGFQIFLDGVLTTGYTVNSTGVVTFTGAPANGVQVSWAGGFYWRLRFDQDEAEFSENIASFFDLKKLTLWGATGNKV